VDSGKAADSAVKEIRNAIRLVRGLLRVAGRDVLVADGIWRVLKPP
jgi:hypothetical protein